MLTEILRYLRNWFDVDSQHNRLPFWRGTFLISDGELSGFSERLKEGQYFRIMDSVFNDGVYRYPTDALKDETFSGVIQSMNIPPAIVELDEQITKWLADNAAIINSPYQSESFGGYTYSKSVSGRSATEQITWQSQFQAQLEPWRKM